MTVPSLNGSALVFTTEIHHFCAENNRKLASMGFFNIFKAKNRRFVIFFVYLCDSIELITLLIYFYYSK